MSGGVPEAAGVEAGVGRTALMVAAARAIETGRSDALAADPYAEHFVRAAAACESWPVHPEQVPDGEDDPLWGRLGRYFGLRTRVFDDHVLRRARAGIRQVVLLGAGLDTRALRLAWPAGCTVFEVDRQEVLAFKQTVLDRIDPRGDERPSIPARSGSSPAPEPPPGAGEPLPGGPFAMAPAEAAAVPSPRTEGTERQPDQGTPARRVTVAADLRLEWVPALAAAGFDPALPTAWVAEGLLLYLPSAAERRLIDTVHAHSAPGSSLAYEVKLTVESTAVRESPVYRDARDRIGVDLLALFDPEPRPDSAAGLAARGWHTQVDTPFDHSGRLGRGPRPERNDALAANRWTFALLP